METVLLMVCKNFWCLTGSIVVGSPCAELSEGVLASCGVRNIDWTLLASSIIMTMEARNCV